MAKSPETWNKIISRQFEKAVAHPWNSLGRLKFSVRLGRKIYHLLNDENRKLVDEWGEKVDSKPDPMPGVVRDSAL